MCLASLALDCFVSIARRTEKRRRRFALPAHSIALDCGGKRSATPLFERRLVFNNQQILRNRQEPVIDPFSVDKSPLLEGEHRHSSVTSSAFFNSNALGDHEYRSDAGA